MPRASKIVKQVCLRVCQRIDGSPDRLSNGLKWRLTMFCRHRPLQGAVQLSQQLVELRLLLLGKSRQLLVHEVLMGRYNLLKKPPPLLGEVETVGPPLLAPRDQPSPLHLVHQAADVALGDEQRITQLFLHAPLRSPHIGQYVEL